jgi:hypothetical protein
VSYSLITFCFVSSCLRKKSNFSIKRSDVTKQAPCSRERTERSSTLTGLIVSRPRTSARILRVCRLGLYRDVTIDRANCPRQIDRTSVPRSESETECNVTISNDIIPDCHSDNTVSFPAFSVPYDFLRQSKPNHFDTSCRNYFRTRLSFCIASLTSRM